MNSTIEVCLPNDAAIDALPVELRQAIAEQWLLRARGELTTASVFTRVAYGLLEIGAAPEVLWLAARAISEEVRHCAICKAVADRYLGRPTPDVRAKHVTEASFGSAPPRINHLLLAVFQSCINEGIASVYLQENLALARSATAHAAIRELLRDDVNHARMGWAHLASEFTTATDREHVGAALPTLLRIGRDAWLRDEGEPNLDCPEHGILGRDRLPALVDSAFAGVILPGFEHVGIDTSAARMT